ncbi:unnamed protein product, partial [Polarella glacialis]
AVLTQPMGRSVSSSSGPPKDGARESSEEPEMEGSGALSGLGHCVACVASFLPLAEVLATRACSREPLQWATQRGDSEHGLQHWVHVRIRARLWMRRLEDVLAGTK